MTDLLVIGSGGAGLTAAIEARQKGFSVIVVTKTLPTQAQTCMAQGGINASLANVTDDDVQLHIQDTLRSSAGLADTDMVSKMCHEASSSLEWLESIGVPFSRIDGADDALSSIAQRRLGGASAKRACYAQDYTGLKILHTLYERSVEVGVRFVSEHYLLNLLVDDDRVVAGAIFWDIQKGEVVAIEAGQTIIATGGYGGLYHEHTTNSYGSSGDGIAAVLRAGGVVSDMEFVQFHPTALHGSAILISESARGEGGYLIDHNGDRFVDELAPRDKVSRAIFAQMQMGHNVRLDIRHLGRQKIETLMPQELHLCRLHAGIDPIEEPIPIMPVAHYTMGGIEVDDQLRVRNLQNCYAIGECSNAKVHGANRLGGNSLLEIIAFGRVVSRHMSKDISTSKCDIEARIEEDKKAIEKIFAKPNEVNFYRKRKILGKLMYKDVGIIRDNAKMHEASVYLNEIHDKLGIMGVGDKEPKNNQDLVEFLEFRNTLVLAKATLLSAISRTESRGAHHRSDFPTTRDEWSRHSYIELVDGDPRARESL